MTNLIEQQKQLLAAAEEEDWFGIYEILNDSGCLIDFSGLPKYPFIEEALMRAMVQNIEDLNLLMLSLDSEIVTRFPKLKQVKSLKGLPLPQIDAWRFSAAMRVLVGIHDLLDIRIQADPHRDHSDLLIRAARFPISQPEFRKVIENCLAKILKYASLLGLELTLGTLQDFNEKMFTDAVAMLIWQPQLHDRADFLWDVRLISHEILNEILPVATKLGFPEESLQWLE